jgi:hypothetical protein
MARPETQREHQTPFMRHFALFLPNRVGQLAELLSILDQEQITLAGMSVVDSTDWAVVRMIFTDPGKARQKLSDHGIAYTESDVLAVVLDEPDSFTKACKLLVAAELNVHFAFALLIRQNDRPVMAFRVDDEVLAVQILSKHGFDLLDHEDLVS